MAKVFSDGDLIDAAFLNKVSASVTDGIGDKKTPVEVRVFIGAEVSGAASQVQTNLDSHKADASIHTPSADVVLQAEKGVANGIPTLDGTTKIPATFLPATGGYAGVYDTQALMVAAAAGHTSGEIFLVTDDPTSALNGEYTATATPPASIADYYFNSGAVAAHTHNAADVNVIALGVTVETDSADIHTDLGLKATDADLTAHTGNTGIHFADAPIDGVQYARKDGSWDTIVSGTGDLKADGSVPMAGSYIAAPLGQSLVTRTMMEENFSNRLGGYKTSGKVSRYGPDLNEFVTCGVYNSPFQPAAELNWPTGMGNYGYVDVVAEGSSIVYQTVRSLNASPKEWWRITADGGSTWSDWVSISDDISTNTADIGTNTGNISTLTTQAGGFTHSKVTQAEYDALTPDENTLYYIVG